MEIPDLSHLTIEEQAQILAVIKRQKDEEEKEKAMTRTLKAQFENYKQQVKEASENAAEEAKRSPDVAREIGRVCDLCSKTKIAEGCGHTCSYCNKIFCTRCGGRVPVVSSKVMWVCNLCRKQTELLTKTGAWHRESRSGMTLHLEPLQDARKLSGSASMAQLGNHTNHQRNPSPRLKKGQSEPQLAQCEIPDNQLQNHISNDIPETKPRNGIAKKKNLLEQTMKRAEATNHSEVIPTDASNISSGVRQSSTHSERRLHRQEQAVAQADNLLTNKVDKVTTRTNHEATTERHPSRLQMQMPDRSISENIASIRSMTDPLKSNPAYSETANNHSKQYSNTQAILTKKTGKEEISKDFRRIENRVPSHLSDAVTVPDRPVQFTAGASTYYAKSITPRSQERIDSNQAEIDRQSIASNRSHSSQTSPFKSEHLTEKSKSRMQDISTPPVHHGNNFHTRHSGRFYPNEQTPHRNIPCPQSYDPSFPDTRNYPNSCQRCKEHRGYSSDNEGSLVPYNSYVPPDHKPKKLRHTEAMITYNDVGPCSCSQVHSKYTPQHCRHGAHSRTGTTAPHGSTDHINCSSSRRVNCNVYHSDVDLSRSAPHYISAEALHSCGYASPRKDHIRRRNCCPRTGADCMHGAPYRKFKSKHLHRNSSLSSDDENQSTPDYSSCDETDKRIDLEAELKDSQLLYISSPFRGDLTEDSVFPLPEFESRSSTLKQRRLSASKLANSPVEEKSIPNSSDSVQRKPTPLQNSANYKRDSGIDTGSSANTVQSDDVNKEQQSVSWQPTADRRFLIGRMTLHKSSAGSTDDPSVGVQISGGKLDELGVPRAFVIRVKKGSVAEKVGHLKPGDEIVMWNGHNFRGASVDEVYKAILATKDENSISLMACRPIQDMPRIPERRQQHPVTESSSSSFDSQKREDEYPPMKTYPQLYSDEPSRSSQAHTKKTLPGKLQVRISFNQQAEQLLVTIIQAVELQPRTGGSLNPYVKMYLLPDRSDDSKRRTKCAKRTINPEWNQTVTYWNIRRQDLDSMSLELTVWDMDKSQAPQSHFLGEVLIDLGLANIENVPQWFRLMQAGAGMNRISDPMLKSRTGLRHVPSSAPSLYAPPRVPCSVSQQDYHSGLGFDSMPRGYVPPKSSATTSSFGSLGAEHRHTHSTKPPPQTTKPPVVITKRSRAATNEPRLSSHTAGRQSPLEDEQFHRETFERKSNRPSAVTSDRHLRQRESPHSSQETSTGQRQRHSSATSSKDITLLDGRRQMFDNTSNLTKTPSHRASETQLLKTRNSSTVSLPQTKNENLAKSASLGANLHEQSRSKSSSPNSKIKSRSKQSDNSKSASPARRSNALGQKITSLVGMRSKSNSSNTLESEKAKSSPRCVEVGIHPDLQRDGSRDSASGSFPSVASEGSSSIDKTLQSFIGGLGPGQVVGRQTLAANSLGEVELGIFNGNGDLEIQVVRARNLVPKANSKVLPAPYVKVYLVFDLKVIAKKKTKIARRTLEPDFNQLISFEPNQYGNSLQLIVWGDYGRMDHKAFMGVAQIRLDGLELSSRVYGWYKLFPSSSLADASVLGGQRIGSMTSLEMEASRS